MQIWDTVGHEKFNSITSNYYKTTDVAIFIYSINDINSFNNINNWYNELNNKNEEDNNMIKILIGNKNDLIKERKVSYDMGNKLKNDKNFNLFKEINCQSNNNKNNNGKKIWNINIEKIDEDEDLDPIKKLFFNIGILIYKEYFEEIRNRVNTNSIYSYEASNSILEFAQESDTKTLNNNFEKHKSCCC
jgi:GTPase SAR1 family protein